jgi:hypothetical protein
MEREHYFSAYRSLVKNSQTPVARGLEAVEALSAVRHQMTGCFAERAEPFSMLPHIPFWRLSGICVAMSSIAYPLDSRCLSCRLAELYVELGQPIAIG